MSRDRDFGSKTGGGGVMSAAQEAIARKERLRQLALETVDLEGKMAHWCSLV
jgi:splicing factor 3A subunit 2